MTCSHCLVYYYTVVQKCRPFYLLAYSLTWCCFELLFLLVCRLNDIIVSVNGISTENVTHAQAVETLKRAGRSVLLVCVLHPVWILLLFTNKQGRCRSCFWMKRTANYTALLNLCIMKWVLTATLFLCPEHFIYKCSTSSLISGSLMLLFKYRKTSDKHWVLSNYRGSETHVLINATLLPQCRVVRVWATY